MQKDFTSQIEALTRIKERFAPPQRVKDNAYIKDYDAVYAYSIRDPEGFWGQIANELEWFAPWERVREFNLPEHKWFVNGKTNITLNALDRHANSWRRNKVAIIWLSEDGREEVATYGQLRDRVNQFANGLKSKGIKKGDRVIILHAVGHRRCDRHAGLRPHRRHSFRGVCRHGRRLPALPCGGL